MIFAGAKKRRTLNLVRLFCEMTPMVDKIGESIAILAGDTLQAFAFEHIVRDTVGVPAERLVKVKTSFCSTWEML